MKKYFEQWNIEKQKINISHQVHKFHTGNIVWFSCGQNIGTEIFGKGDGFFRPGIILKKVFFDGYIIIPLSSKISTGTYYYTFIDSKKKEQCALLHQTKYIDEKRIAYKKSQVPLSIFKSLKVAYINFIK